MTRIAPRTAARRLFTAVLLAAAAPAHAADNDWWMAETDHFKVISEGGADKAAKTAADLERLDQALRMFRNLPLDGSDVEDSMKVTIYQYGTTRDVGALVGSQSVAGFFIPRAGDSVAFVPNREETRRGQIGTRSDDREELDSQKVLFHEYAHYFSRQHAPAAYPFWYSEGFAELFATIKFTDTGFALGEPPRYRGEVLRSLTFKVEDILNLDVKDDQVSGLDIIRQYGYGWMFASYLSFEPSRQGQLAQYLRLVTAGTPNLDAARQAFGDLGKLQGDLERYHRGRVRMLGVEFKPGSAPEPKLTRLTAAQAAAMPVRMQSTAGVKEEDAAALAAKARALLASHPNDPATLDAAMEAEFDAKNYAAAETLAQRLKTAAPDSVRPHLILAGVAREQAKTDPAKLAAVRQHLADAHAVDNKRADVLAAYFDTYAIAGDTIPESAKAGLETAFDLAPFDIEVRRSLAYLLLLENRDKEARIILNPVANVPHDTSKRTKRLREAMGKLDAGERQALIDELRPTLKDADEDEDAKKS